MKITINKLFALLFLVNIANVFSQTCTVPTSERNALIALYNATNGPNWDNNTNWNTAADVCDWYGVTVTNGVVTALNLVEIQLSGSIPAEMGNLTNLTHLNLEFNSIGIITEIGNLTSLTHLNLEGNSIGSIPTGIGNLTNLTQLNLGYNQITGSIPSEIGNLTNLTQLNLVFNQITGSIPSEIGNLTNLTQLNLGHNQITGSIPTGIGNLTNLNGLNLYENKLTGSIPTGIGNLINLTSLRLQSNQITGSIPSEIGNLTNLNSLDLSGNKLTGSIPTGIGMLAMLNLDYLRFYDNAFVFSDFENEHATYTANIPTYYYSPQAKVDIVEIPFAIEGTSYTFTTSLSSPNNSYQWYKDGAAISGATSKDYTINSVSLTDAGVYYVVATNSIVTGLTLQRNNVTLTVTPYTCSVPQSERDALIALYNATNGPNWANNTNWNTAVDVCDWYGVTVTNETVTSLNLFENNLTGIIPPELGSLTNLTSLEFFGNNLSGAIPPELGNTSLEHIGLANNQLTGAVPVELTSLTNLYELFLEANQLSGDIPDFTNLTNLDRFLFAINKFVFSDFETEHGTYLANLSSYAYDLQAKVDTIETPTVTEGTSYTFSTSLSSPNNNYQWYKDGVAISGATSKDYTLNPVSLTDAGVYYVVATNSIVTGLTLQRNDVTLTVTPDTCGVQQSERDALITLYNATNGPNWTNNTNWNTTVPVCDWHGVTVTNGTVTEIRLTSNNLNGEIPSTIENLTGLTLLYLSNNQLTGVIPSELGNMLNLTYLSLQTNQLSGTIPFQIGNLTNLAYLNLQNNQLSGAIPFQIGNLTNLEQLHLVSNQLTGSIPAELGNLSGLQGLDLRNNQLTGNIPLELGNLSGLQVLYLQNNQLTGSIPAEIGNLTNLTDLRLEFNQITGSIPTEIGNLTNLNSLFLSNNQLSGTIPSEIGNLNSLIWLYLSSNQLQGAIPDFTNSVNLNNLYFTNNRFIFSDFENEHSIYTGYSTYTYSPQAKVDTIETPTVTEGSSYTFTTSLSSPNNSYQWYKDGIAISGATSKDYTINPVSLTDAGVYYVVATNSVVTGLTLQRNDVTLTVTPDTCGVPQSERDALMALYVATNGPNWANNTNWNTAADVCDWYGVTVNDGAVSILELSNNQLTGSIPVELGNLSNLTELLIRDNQLTGSIPVELGNLSNLTDLDLRNNQLTGSIPAELGGLTSLAYLNLSINQLTGNIPGELGSLSNLTYLNLSTNQLTGSVPTELGSLSSLVSLSLNINQLTGSIPTELISLSNLSFLFFNGNNFIFSDFENEHNAYTTNLTIYTYSPQAKVDQEETINLTEEDSYTLTTSLSSPNNSYQWYKDGVAISGATSKDYTINPVSLTDAGVYYVVANNSIVTGLTLQRNDITLTVTPDTCGVPQSERDALMALYDATNGPNWTNTLANNQAWDINTPVCNWYGVTVENGHVVKLILIDNGLINNMPTDLQYLTFLKELNFDRNNLDGHIPIELRYLTNLEVLSLFRNKLTGTIPPQLGELTNLRILDLNNVWSIGIENGIKTIEGQLTGNIPDELGNLINLEFFGVLANRLSGKIPSALATNTNLDTLYIGENRFVFSDFEDEHPTYTGNLATYWYTPQAKVDQEETINLTEGNSITLTSNQLTSPNNSYQWYKDGIAITNATSKDYVIANATFSDAGVYHFTATNNIVTGLTLQRNDITLTVNACVVPQIERDALMALYNDTDGDNWTNTFANNQPWDINTLVCSWYGVTVENGHVTRLTLPSNQLSGEIPAALGNLTNLIYLNVGNNELSGTIPEVLGQLTKLRYVYINNNNLHGNIPLTSNFLGTFGGGFLHFNNNAFVFKDFQDWHSDYYIYMDEDEGYQYSPQAKIDQEETIILTTSDSYTLTNSLSNGNNLYQWQISTDGGLTFTNIDNATSHDYIINGSSVTEGLYRVKVNNDMVGGLTLYRHNYTVIVGAANTFCTSEWNESPTINNLTPSGPNIEWYTTETGGTPLNDVDKLGDHPISTYWWDDITDGNSARTAAIITIDENSPEGNEIQFFSLGANATVNDLMASGTNVQWFNSAFSDTPLNGETPLVDDTIYYAEDVGTTTCRLGVEVYLETEAPTGNTLQMVCHNSKIANLSIISQSGATVVWYDSETGTNTLETTTPLVEGTTYYAAQIDSFGYESIERLGINITFFDTQPPMVPSNVQKFYSNEPATVAHLLVKGNNVQWYSQSTEGVLLGVSTPLVDGDNYYAQHTDGTCISGRVAVTVDILDEPLPTIISCEKFKPQLGGHYVISGWVKERVASATPSEIKPFSDVATHFIDLINHLKDRLLSEDPSLHDIPAVYIPNSDTEVLNFDPLVPFVVGLPAGETKLTVYNFERILDNYGGNNKGRIIGFKFSLSNQENAPVFQYQTPFAEVYNCDSCYDKQLLNNVNYPLYSINSETLNFTGATVSNGILTVSQSFNFTNPDPITVPNITGATLFSESITYYDYIEDSYYQSPTYEHAKIELTYVDENGDILIDTNGSIVQSIFSPQGAIIDGWQRIMGEFKIPTNAKLLNLNLKSGSSDINAYFDDMRIHPFDSNMKTFVYHPETQRLTSELDENNYATFYEYDLEGGLVRVKKETEKGIYTIQETRSGNVKATN